MRYLIRAKPTRKTEESLARSFKTPYKQHQIVWDLMSQSTDQERDFLWRWDSENNKGDYLWILGSNLPEDREGIFSEIVHKEFSPKLVEGMRLEFQVRLNPVIRIRENNKRKKVDAVMHLKKKHGKEKNQDELTHEASIRWMKSKEGFEIFEDTLRVDAYRQVKFRKKKQGNVVQYSTLELSGILKVSDVIAFENVLYQGLGSAKSFGCGLMLIKPAR